MRVATVNTPGSSLQEADACAHCGAGGAAILRGAEKFCCEGCAQVYSILKDQDMLGFYEIPENSIRSLKEKPVADYGYCDSEWFRRMFVRDSGKGSWSIRMRLPDIHCAACVWLLEKLPAMLEGVSSARINYLRKQLDITASADLPVSHLVQFVANLGYPPDFAKESATSRRLSAYDKSLLRKMAVAAFGFGNAMLFSLPEYFTAHLESSFSRTFLALNAALSVVVLVYSAGDFFRSAWRALKQRQIVIDVPISVGIAAMFTRSAVDVATGASAGYFDTFTGLIFFLLIGRFVQSRSYAWLNFERDNLLFLPLAVRVRTADGEAVTPVQQIKRGDILRLLAGEIAPTRCRVISEEGAADYAFISGESLPVSLKRGDVFEPGGKVVGKSLLLEVLEEVDQARLNRIWEAAEPETGTETYSSGSAFAERVLPYFTGTVIAIASGALLYWLPTDGARAWNAFSAVLVITCPCALAMAKPFSFFTTQSVLARAGLFLKSAAVVERFFALKNIVFDKTGTLTSPGKYDVEFRAAVREPVSQQLQAIMALANESSHPLSRAIAEFLPHTAETVLSDFIEKPGKGTSARINGATYFLGSQAWLVENGVTVPEVAEAGFSSVVHAGSDKEYLGCFLIRNRLRGDLGQTLAELGSQYRIALLSGDSDRERSRFAQYFADSGELYFNATPARKAEIIAAMRKNGATMMIGDGLNDAEALRAADLGVALTENHSNFSPASDAILSAESLHRLPQLISQAAQARRTAIAAYAVSFGYNIFGIGVAVAGDLTPLFCAILMPISSLSVIGLAFASARLGAALRRLN
ncbi:MAG: heavy metal translocating P-type ATPase metal-binding domain-containing protein [Turneriella sp.]